MKNPLTFRIESWIGAIFILGLALYFSLIIFKAVKEFERELIRIEADRNELIFDRR